MNSLFSYLKVLICVFSISGSYILGKELSITAAPEVLATLRFVISSLCFLPFIPYKEFKKLKMQDFILLVLASFFGMFLYNFLFFLAIRSTTPINISLVNATIPILTLIFYSIAHFILPTQKQILAFILSFTGVALIITKGNFNAKLLAGSNGEFLMLAGACCWVTYGLLIKKIMSRTSALMVTFITGFFGCIELILLSYFNNTLQSIALLNTYQWLCIGYIGSFGTALAFFLYAQTVKNFGTKLGNFVVFSMVPMIVALLSYFLLNVSLNSWQLIGGILVLTALWLNMKSNK